MFSFLNGKSPFDEAEEKLEAGETVNGRPKMPTGPIMGWQDGLFLLVVIGLIVGGYQYYQHSKTSSAETFARCNALFDAAAEAPEKYLEAEACFDSTWDLGFVSDTMEVLRQNRVGEIQDKRNAQKDVLEDAKDALSLKDTAKAVEILRSYQGAMFLRNYDKDDWEKIAKLEVATVADSTGAVADSTGASAGDEKAPAEKAAK
jgi:hypothetical protein